jgi:hypothetical protein
MHGAFISRSLKLLQPALQIYNVKWRQPVLSWLSGFVASLLTRDRNAQIRWTRCTGPFSCRLRYCLDIDIFDKFTFGL